MEVQEMAQQEINQLAEIGTKQTETSENRLNPTPKWDNWGDISQLPFFNPTEEDKRDGFRVRFLEDGPRCEKENTFDPKIRGPNFGLILLSLVVSRKR